MAIDPIIKKKADDIRNKIYGKEVRESLASGLEEMSTDVVDTVSRQGNVESQFQDVIENTTDKDVISAPEIIAARNGEANLKTRLDKEHQEVTTRLAPIAINVKSFDVVGDGITDDTANIQLAINSLQKGEVLFFGEGDFLVTGLILNGYKKLDGGGANILYYGTGIVFDVPDDELYNTIELENFNIFQKNNLKVGVAINIQKSINGSKIGGCLISGFNIGITHSQDEGHYSGVTHIYNCEIRENEIGIYFYKDSNIVTVRECNFRYNETHAIVLNRSHKVTIDANLFEFNAKKTISSCIHNMQSYTTSIINNYFENNGEPIETSTCVLVSLRSRGVNILSNFFNSKDKHSSIRIGEDVVGTTIIGNNMHEDGSPTFADIIFDGVKTINQTAVLGNKASAVATPLVINGLVSISSTIKHGGDEYAWQKKLSGSRPRITMVDTATNKTTVIDSTFNSINFRNHDNELMFKVDGQTLATQIALDVKGKDFVPVPIAKGHVYISPAEGKILWWTGTVWKDAMGNIVDVNE